LAGFSPVFLVMTVSLQVGELTATAQSTLSAGTVGALYAQNAPIEQARLFDRPAGTQAAGMTADGTALPDSGTTASEDDSFGAQQILKNQERVREFAVIGDAAVFYTSNVALTRHGTIEDSFVVVNAGMSWNHAIDSQLQMQIGVRGSIFRYADTSALDFENLGAGVGLARAPSCTWGISFFGRYDFSELLDKHSRQILSDHEFSVGAQKVFPLGRSHALTAGAIASAGISDPFAAQRDSVSLFTGYTVAITRQLQGELFYRLSGNFYNGGGRDDLNQIASMGLHYHFTPWAELNALLSFGSNRSTHDVFSYDVLNAGGGVGLVVRF
jgi:hypothetical protein